MMIGVEPEAEFNSEIQIKEQKDEDIKIESLTPR